LIYERLTLLVLMIAKGAKQRWDENNPKPVPRSTQRKFDQLKNEHSGIINIIADMKPELDGISYFVIPEIPIRKLENAINSYVPANDKANVILLYDHTAFGSSRSGFCITPSHIYWKNDFSRPQKIELSAIKSVKKKPIEDHKIIINDNRKIVIDIGEHAIDKFIKLIVNICKL
jgi:hypothetical protein